MVFGGFMLYDTQKIIKYAELTTYQGKTYDPINAYVSYLFIKICLQRAVSHSFDVYSLDEYRCIAFVAYSEEISSLVL